MPPLAMRDGLKELNREVEPMFSVSLAMRVGIDHGTVVVKMLDEWCGTEVAIVGRRSTGPPASIGRSGGAC